MFPRKTSSPPIEMQSSDAPWNESHIEMVLCRPVARRASFMAIPTALVPPGQRSTLARLGSGESSVSLRASATALALV
jgi:hypothetical protein